MRFLLTFELPHEPFNTLVKTGQVGPVMEKVMADLKPEAIYFATQNGHRGGVAIVNMDDVSQMPSLGEPLFLAYNAKVNVQPIMTAEDLAKAGLDEIGAKYK